MDTTPYWIEGSGVPHFPTLRRDLSVDVVVIGGGITGITATYLLNKSGASVALLERGRFAAADTGHTTAHLTYVTDLRLAELVKNFGRDHAQAVWDAGLAGMNQIHQIVEEEGIGCEFEWVPGYLHAALKTGVGDERSALKKDAKLAAELGFDARYEASVPYLKIPGIRFANQAKFHPRKYLAGLLRALSRNGCHLHENTSAEEVLTDPLQVKTKGGVVSARYVVIATHVPLQGATGTLSATLFQTKLALYTSYAVGAQIPQGSVPEACFWDTSDPYYFLRIDRGKRHDYAIFGGEDHKTGQVRDPGQRFSRLEKRLRKLIPGAAIDHRWSGQVIETNDGLPLVGETAPKQFVATGFSGNGMTFGTLSAMMACDAFRGRANPWRELFDVNRKKVRGGSWDYLRENKDYPYYFLKDRFAKAEGKSLRSIKRGEGKIIKLGGEKVAAFRSSQGKLTVRSAVCTHMGCLVRWNGAEQTWDCPCHGSRFKATGEVLAGPAETDLPEGAGH